MKTLTLQPRQTLPPGFAREILGLKSSDDENWRSIRELKPETESKTPHTDAIALAAAQSAFQVAVAK